MHVYFHLSNLELGLVTNMQPPVIHSGNFKRLIYKLGDVNGITEKCAHSDSKSKKKFKKKLKRANTKRLMHH